MWYFKGRRKKYKSPYTGKEVDAAVKKAEDTTATAEEINAAATFVNSLSSTPAELDNATEFVKNFPVISPTGADAFKSVCVDEMGEKYTLFKSNKLDLINDVITLSVSPVELDISSFNFPASRWDVKVNEHELTYEPDVDSFFYIDNEDPENMKAYIIAKAENPYKYTFACIDGEENLIPGTYNIVIVGEEIKGNGTIMISNLECSKTFKEVEYLFTNNLIENIVNPAGVNAIDAQFSSTLFTATFPAINGSGISLTTYKLDENEQITTVVNTTNIVIS